MPPKGQDTRPPRKNFNPGTYFESWPDVYSSDAAGAQAPWTIGPVPPPTGPEAQRPHRTVGASR
jgi:hypothetical protein